MASDAPKDNDLIEVDVLVLGGGTAGQAAALAAHEAGANRIMLLHKGPSATAISTGFLTFWTGDALSAEQANEAMFEITGKQICDRAMLERFISEGPKEISAALKDYEIPYDVTPRGVRVRKSRQSGRELAGERIVDEGIQDMTAIVMEFSATHGTSLFSQLLKAVKATPIDRVKGTALHILPDGPGVQALIRGRLVTIMASAVILCTGGVQGLYEFTDSPRTLTGDGLAMALETGASLIDMEFMQFYPLALAEEGLPTVFIYPDFATTTRIVNDKGEDLIDKYFGGEQQLARFDNWDHLSVVEQAEITEGRSIYLDFSTTKDEDWSETSLTKMYLEKYVGDFRARPIKVSPIMHYTIGGLRVDIEGETGIPGVYACGEVVGGLHGANRHGGTALAEGIIFGRICGRHAAARAREHEPRRSNVAPPPERHEGKDFGFMAAMGRLRRLNQMALGPLRSAAGLESLGRDLAALSREAEALGWHDYQEYGEVLTYRRSLRISECMRASMLRRTESRGVHARSDFEDSDPTWIRKQALHLDERGAPVFEDVPI